ncbi:MAG: hypothetical protein DYH05_00720, partial [Acidobacteria bacterium ACB1]|nr:hypothetical protein [Acidobacteria bacterium ACB1]
HFAKFSKTLPRDSLLCVLRGLPFAAFAFSAYRIHAISHSIFHVDPNAKNANTFAKLSKTLPRKVQTKLSNINQPQEA